MRPRSRSAAGNSPPVPSIDSPPVGTTFAVGQTVALQGSATDPQSGTLSGAALSWEVLLHHNNDHTHSVDSGTGGSLSFPYPAPEDLPAAVSSFVEVRLTATDPHGLSATVSRSFQPRRVLLTLATSPPGLIVEANGIAYQGPTPVTSWQGYRIRLQAPSPQGRHVFRSWSQRVATVVTPSLPRTYTARFLKLPAALDPWMWRFVAGAVSAPTRAAPGR